MSNLPAIRDIYSDSVDIIKENNLNVLLNQPPKESWIKQHPIAKNVKYIPIERVEYLLTSIFIKWHVEVKSVQLVANSVAIAKNVIDGKDGLTGLTGGPKIDNVPTAYTLIDTLTIDDKQQTYNLIFATGYKKEDNSTFSNIDFSQYKD